MNRLEKLKPLAQLLLRCALGIIFMYHGYPKLFTDREQFFRFFEHIGFPYYLVYFVGALELIGGGLLILGLFTRIIALMLSVEMGVAIYKVHLVKGLLAVGVYQLPLIVGVAAFILMAVGAGQLSLDHALFRAKA
jgi:putative oxidoreductase